MSDLLPISIKVNKALEKQFSTLNSIKNKLEAQLNFQTLTANWYGDEENILCISLFLENEVGFSAHKKHLKKQNKTIDKGQVEYINYSDDVFSCFYQNDNKIDVCIALTPSELNLLLKSPKVIATFLQVKLLKVLNLMAKKLALPLLTYS